MKYKIVHTNTFQYDSPVEQSLNTIRLKPRNNECQRLLSFRSRITPASMASEHVDIWGNNIGSFFIPEKHQLLEVETKSIVSIQKAPYLQQIQFSSEMQAIFYSKLFHEHYLPYLRTTNYTYLEKQQLKEVIAKIGTNSDPIQFAIRLMDFLYNEFTYNTETTTVDTTAQEAFQLKSGVCQDLTHVMLGILRNNGIPARYISGYLYIGENSNLVGDNATHAWVEIMVPGIGWIGLDPTNNVEVLENHVVLCKGRDYSDVSPLQGVYHGGPHTLEVKVEVIKLTPE